MAIEITLSSANMGDVDELDFDLWSRYVADNLEAATGIDAVLDQARFGETGADRISGATEAEHVAIRQWLGVDGWESFCGETWTRMRAEAERAT